MTRLFRIFALLLPATLWSSAQAATLKDPNVVAGVTLSEARVGADVPAPDACSLGSYKSMRRPGVVLVTGIVKCRKQYESAEHIFWRIARYGKAYYIEKDNVALPEADSARLLAMTDEEAAEFAAKAEEKAALLHTRLRESALKNVAKTKALGLAVLRSGVTDESEHTQGTGFHAEIYNSSGKPIKYVTFNVVGLNPVKDVVASRGRSSVPLRAIGPIEAGEVSRYSFDYVWFTDLVESSRIASIKVEYMDKTVKTIANPKLVTLDALDYDLLFGDVQ